MLLVKKNDGSWHLCVNYQNLNQVTIKQPYPIPVIDELLDEVHRSSKFSKINLCSGYHQIRMKHQDIGKMVFPTYHGLFEFKVMTFGTCNAPATFQALMNRVFQPFVRKFMLVFFDDMLVYSKVWDEHLQHLQSILLVLRQNKLLVKLCKCEFGIRRIKYLGHILSTEGVSMDKDKIKEALVLNQPTPKSLKALRGFLGLFEYYRKFISGYCVIAEPLTTFIREGNFTWTLEGEIAFQQLKQALKQAPILSMLDFTKLFIVECDASSSGIGVVLL